MGCLLSAPRKLAVPVQLVVLITAYSTGHQSLCGLSPDTTTLRKARKSQMAPSPSLQKQGQLSSDLRGREFKEPLQRRVWALGSDMY